MPSRKIPLVSGEVYHVFNRSVAKQPIFSTRRDYSRFLETLSYYQFSGNPIRFSHFFRMSEEDKANQMKILRKHTKSVELFAFCIMPNHFHILVRQLEDDGLMAFVRNIQNSYAKYFNIKYKRTGSLFQEQFKAVLIDDDNQLLHVCRYIHLNPTTSNLLKNFDQLKTYPGTSLIDYIKDNEREIIQTKHILDMFSNNKARFLRFNKDQEDYQRNLWLIKHLLLE